MDSGSAEEIITNEGSKSFEISQLSQTEKKNVTNIFQKDPTKWMKLNKNSADVL